ncbi:MAG: protein kinase [Planctomycetes bacterium]|nr:protein kinase [Planctomycetota bacterium]
MDITSYDLRGAELDGLRLNQKLGQGGMGEVWLGQDLDLDIPVAVKVLPAHLASDQAFLVHFIREARAIARLDHPHIVRVYQAGRRAFKGATLRILVMEYIEGQDVDALLTLSKHGRLEPEFAGQIALAAARALRYAHAQGVVHRDIKPANIIVSADNTKIKVLDFGLATMFAPDKTRIRALDDEEGMVGTPLYMSPEQAREEAVDGASDVYSLGISLYEMLVGRPPFEGASLHQTLLAHLRQPLPTDEPEFDELPSLVRPLLEGMCQKRAIDRLGIDEVIQQLRVLSGAGQSASSEMVTEPSVPEKRTNIVPRATSFVGRDDDLRALDTMLGDKFVRIISLLGPGGVGKTRLAQELGLRSLERFAGGVFFADLTEAQSAEDIRACVAKAVGVALHHDLNEAIASALKMRRDETLVILDNFEHLVDAAASVLAPWIAEASQVRFLATSREALHLEGERPYVLQPLLGSASDSGVSAGVTLFIERAKEVRRGFAPDAKEIDTIAEVVDAIDGIPLAIELAAARAATLTPAQILERLPRRFELLTSRRKDQSQRQMTLRATIDWSWNLLSDWERSALVQCSVFRGGFFLEAAEAVLALGDFEEAPFQIDAIDALVSKSLLVCEPASIIGETRYRMLESVRQYALERLLEHRPASGQTLDPVVELLKRHARFYLKYAQFWNARLASTEGLEALDRLELEVENVMAVQDGLGKDAPLVSAQAISSIVRVLMRRGPTTEILPRIAKALDAMGSLDNERRARLLAQYADALREFGERKKALAACEEALVLLQGLYPSTENRLLFSKLHCALAWFSATGGDFEAADESARKAEAFVLDVASESSQALINMLKGDLHSYRGEFERGLAYYLAAEDYFRKKGDDCELMGPLTNRGNVYLDRSEFDDAIVCLEEAETIAKRFRFPRKVAVSMACRGEAFVETARYSRAKEVLFDAAELDRKIGYRHHLAHVLRVLMLVDLRVGEAKAALANALESLAILRDLNNERSMSAFAALAGAAKANLLLAEESNSGSATLSHRTQAKTFANAATTLGESLKIPRVIDHGPGEGEVLEYWQWVEEVSHAT